MGHVAPAVVLMPDRMLALNPAPLPAVTGTVIRVSRPAAGYLVAKRTAAGGKQPLCRQSFKSLP